MSDAGGNGAAEPIAPASLVGQLRRAITRLNQRALRFTQPGPRWLLTSVKLGFALVEAFATGTSGHGTPRPSRSIVSFAILAGVIAPVIETLQIMLVHLLTRRWIGLAGFVAASTVLAYALHGPPLTYDPAGAAAAFLD